MMFGITNVGVQPDDLEKAMLAEVEKVKNGDISDEDFQKLKNQEENDFVSQNQRILGVINNLATYYTFLGNANLINTELERYNKVTKADLKRVANKYFTKENRLVVDYLPKSEQKNN
jgi:predicted Zn-dependent peptidase